MLALRAMCVFALIFGTCLPMAAEELPSLVPEVGETQMKVPTTLAENRDVVATLSDTEARRLLLERMDAEVEENEASEKVTFGAVLAATSTAVQQSLQNGFQRLPNLMTVLHYSLAEFVSTLSVSGATTLVGTLVVSVFLAWAASKLIEARFRLNTRLGAVSADAANSIQVLFLRFFKEALGTVVLLVAALSLSDLYLDEQLSEYAGSILFFLLVIPRVGWMVSRFLLAPQKEEFRLLTIGSEDAQRLHKYLVGLCTLIGLAGFLTAFAEMSGVPLGQSGFGFWANLCIHVYLIVLLWRNRFGLQEMMRGNPALGGRRDHSFALAYPYIGIVASVVLWVVVKIVAANGNYELLHEQPHYITMFVLLAAPVLDSGIRAFVLNFTAPGHFLRDTAVLPQDKKATAQYSIARSYVRIARVIIAISAIFIVAGVWEIDLQNLAAAGVGVAIAGRCFEAAAIVAVGYLISETLSLAVNKKMMSELATALEDESDGAGDEGGAGGSRLATVLPLISMSLQIFLFVLFTLLTLGHLGVDTTPLLAGAGIVGLAVGFGAQKLVSDIVSGIFFLIDDAFRTGEYVEVGATMGTVERISIRSMQLRHHRGPVHTIPFGEIPKITNYSRDWVIMKLKFTVPFETDPNKVKKIFKRIGAEMGTLPEFKDDFLQPFKSQGVFEVNDVGMVIRGKFMAKPGKQFMIRKEIYNRVKAEFAANGIEFARREVRVALPDNVAGNVSEEAAATIKAAVAQSVVPEQEVPEPTAKPE